MINENEKNIWDFVKNKLKYDDKINADIYNAYISKSFLFEQIEKNIIISVKDNVSRNIINNINEKIIQIIKKEYKIDVNIKYKTKEEIKKNNYTKTNITNNKIKNDFGFDNFFSGQSNLAAFKASIQVAEKPGELWNPFFIYGDSGLGKTHLLQAIKNEIRKNSDYQVEYISSEEFGTLTIDKMQKGYIETEKFKNNFKNLDVLLIDDIQFLAKRQKTNEIFFYILNYFIENKKQIVISSDKMPDELKLGFEKRLISRFNSGLNIKILKPDYETALGIIKLKLKNKKNEKMFSKDSVEYIAKNFSVDVRKIEGTINRLLFYSILQKQKNELIEISDIKEAFKSDDFKENNTQEKNISTKKIQNIICQEYNITLKILLGKSRISSVAIPRHVAMFFCRKLTQLRLADIAQDFKRKDHSTVINSIKKIEQEIKNNKKFKKFLDSLENKILK